MSVSPRTVLAPQAARASLVPLFPFFVPSVPGLPALYRAWPVFTVPKGAPSSAVDRLVLGSPESELHHLEPLFDYKCTFLSSHS